MLENFIIFCVGILVGGCATYHIIVELVQWGVDEGKIEITFKNTLDN
jgi:hypothetical protein